MWICIIKSTKKIVQEQNNPNTINLLGNAHEFYVRILALSVV